MGARRCAVGRGRSTGSARSDRRLLQAPALTLGETAPDAEPLVVGEGVLQALGPDFAGETDLLRLAGRSALLGEEGLGIGLGAQCALLPAELLVRVLDQQLLEQLGHLRPSSVSCVP